MSIVRRSFGSSESEYSISQTVLDYSTVGTAGLITVWMAPFTCFLEDLFMGSLGVLPSVSISLRRLRATSGGLAAVTLSTSNTVLVQTNTEYQRISLNDDETSQQFKDRTLHVGDLLQFLGSGNGSARSISYGIHVSTVQDVKNLYLNINA